MKEMRAHKRDRKLCGHCGKACGDLKCARCLQVRYCDAECQKAAWKAHKSECKKRREVAASIDAARGSIDGAQFAPFGTDVVKKLSEAGIDALPSAEEMATFQGQMDVFRKWVRLGTLSKIMRAHRCVKFGTGGSKSVGDAVEVVEAKGKAGTRKVVCFVQWSDFLDFKDRMLDRGEGQTLLTMSCYDEADVRAVFPKGPATDMLLKAFSTFDPREAFLCSFADQSLGPYADATMAVPWDMPGAA